MAELNTTMDVNVDCTAMVNVELTTMLVQLVTDLRERCKRLEEELHNPMLRLSVEQDDLASVCAERDRLLHERDEALSQLDVSKTGRDYWLEQHGMVIRERDELQADRKSTRPNSSH